MPSTSSSPICPAPATTSTMPNIDMTRALQRRPSNRSPNQATEASATRAGIEVEDQQRQRDADTGERDEHAQIEDRVGDGSARHEPAVARGSVRSPVIGTLLPSARHMPSASTTHRAPSAARQVTSARLETPACERRTPPAARGWRRRTPRPAPCRRRAGHAGAEPAAGTGPARLVRAAHRGDSASALSASADSSSADNRSQSAASRSTASRAAL